MQYFYHLSDIGITITEVKIWSRFVPDNFLHEAEQVKWKEKKKRPTWMEEDSTGTLICEKDYCGPKDSVCPCNFQTLSGYPFTRHSYKDLGSHSGLCCSPV